jgi:hypothetical protein
MNDGIEFWLEILQEIIGQRGRERDRHIYIYIYIDGERERDGERWRDGEMERWRDGEMERVYSTAPLRLSMQNCGTTTHWQERGMLVSERESAK